MNFWNHGNKKGRKRVWENTRTQKILDNLFGNKSEWKERTKKEVGLITAKNKFKNEI